MTQSVKPKFRLNQKVTILTGKYLDGHLDVGFVIGIEKYSEQTYVSLMSAKHFLSLLNAFRYKVVFEQGARLQTSHVLENDLRAER
jgi:hypothetical protein